MRRISIAALAVWAAACSSGTGATPTEAPPIVPAVEYDAAPPSPTARVVPPPADEVARLGLDSFYAKYASARGLPVVSSVLVSDYALLEAAHLIERMLEGRDDVLQAMIDSKLRVIVMATTEMTTDIPEHSNLEPKAYWDKRARGLGPNDETHAMSAGEENLLGYRGDPYPTESIFVHEFAHAIHARGAARVDATFDERLATAYRSALEDGRWNGTYAASNRHEYWAEGVQSWFDTNRENDGEHNDIDTREELRDYDRPLVELLVEVHGDRAWRYTNPSARADDPHLAGYDAAAAPTFAWPDGVVAAYQAHQRGDGLVGLEALPLSDLASSRSPASDEHTRIRVVNALDEHITLHWVDSDGGHRQYARIAPGTHVEQGTYVGHLWVAKTEDGTARLLFAAGVEPGQISVTR
jgi:hypothetical protein